jgi:hypothetical protein
MRSAPQRRRFAGRPPEGGIVNENGTWSATKIFEALVSGDRHAADTAMAALVTLGDDVDRRALRNLIRDRLQSGHTSGEGSDQVIARLLTALVRITEDELEMTAHTTSTDRQELSRRLAIEVGGNAAFEKVRARTTAVEQYTAAVDEAETRVRALFEAAIRQASRSRPAWTWSSSTSACCCWPAAPPPCSWATARRWWEPPSSAASASSPSSTP